MKATCPVCAREISLTPKGGVFVKHDHAKGAVCRGVGKSPDATEDRTHVVSEARPTGHYVTPEQIERIRRAQLNEARPTEPLAPVYVLPTALVQQDFTLVPPWPTYQERNGQRWQPVSHKRGKRRASR